MLHPETPDGATVAAKQLSGKEGTRMRATTTPWGDPARWTAEDLLTMPDDGWRYELVQGRLVRMAPTSWGHGRATNRLRRALDRFVEEHGLGEVVPAETGFNLTLPGEPEDTVLGADIAFVRSDRLPAPDTDTFAALAPDLVVETASRGQHRPAMRAKARLWLARGVRMVWVVWPRRRAIEVWLPGDEEPRATLQEGDVLDGGDVVPGFSHPVADVFR
jgi:Uma2 family endonuclease